MAIYYKMKKKKKGYFGMPKGMKNGAYIFCAVMMIPAVIGIIKYLYVNTQSILLAFTDGEVFKDPFSLGNFRMLFMDLKDGGEVAVATINTFKYFAAGLILQCLSYVVAYFLYKKIPGYGAFRLIFFLPCVIAPVITAMIFKQLIRPGGIVWNLCKNVFHKEYEDLLFYPETATNTILVFTFLNGFGSAFLIFIGAMNRIPQEIIESANLDGCKAGKEFRHIILPLTWSTYSVFLLMSVACVFTASGPILYLTNGGAKTYTIGFWIYSQVKGNAINYPAAIGVFFTLIGIPIVLLTRFLINKLDSGVTY